MGPVNDYVKENKIKHQDLSAKVGLRCSVQGLKMWVTGRCGRQMCVCSEFNCVYICSQGKRTGENIMTVLER